MRRMLVLIAVGLLIVVATAVGVGSSATVGAETGANGKLTVTPGSGLTPGGTINPLPTGVTGTPSVTISVANASSFWRIGTCPGRAAPPPAQTPLPFPPSTGADCDLEGWGGAGVAGDVTGSDVTKVIDLLPYVCGVGPVVDVTGPGTPTVDSGGRVALALVEGPGFGTVTDYVELSYDCGGSSSPTTTPTTAPGPGTAPLACPTAGSGAAGQANPDSVPAGGTTTFTGGGFPPGAGVALVICSDPVSIGSVVAGADGSFSARVTIPGGTVTGAHSLVATGPSGDGGTRTVVAGIQVTASAVTATPQFTG